MRYFRDQEGKNHAIDRIEDVYRLPSGCVELSQNEIDQLFEKTTEQAAAAAFVAKLEKDMTAAKEYAKLKALMGMSPAQVQTWVASNVTNLAQAQDAIATLAIAVSVLARRSL